MRTPVVTAAIGLVCCVWLSVANATVTILAHGHIYTGNPSQPWAQAIAFREGRIVAVGADAEVLGK